jgi:hypothetical protein
VIRAIMMSCMLMELAAVNAASSEIVEIPLPALNRTYRCDSTGCDNWDTASVQLERVPETVYGVWIRVSGTVTAGQFWCDFGWPPPYMIPVGMQFGADMYDSLNGHWWGAGFVTLDESGTFQYQAQFGQCCGATWEFLRSRKADVRLGAWPNCAFLECEPRVWPEATVNEAVLVIEADWSVATRGSSWGAIKSLYR